MMSPNMNETYALRKFDGAAPHEIEEALERSEVVYFERCPVELPSKEDLDLLRSAGHGQLKAKNISYHPETDSVPRFEAPPQIKSRVENALRSYGRRVEAYLRRAVPDYVDGWSFGTTSFRPVEEQGRNLPPRSSNELVHIDAGAYGATNGARILRFFVNVHADSDRVWGTKGGFGDLMGRYAALWDAACAGKDRVPLRKSLLDKLYSGAIRTLSAAYPIARVIDSSPYDRSMRRIHNYMKETPGFRDSREDYREIHFPPLSAWMVFTDGLSHSVLRGQHALVTTAIVPLGNCRIPQLAPYHVLATRAA